MRTLAIDLGERRVGLALSDEGGQWATPYDVLEISSPQQATAAVLRAIEREQPARVIVGVPLNMDGSAGDAARQAIAWAKQLEKQSKLPVLLVDERLSSFEADQRLSQRRRSGEKLTRGAKKKQRDAVAAAVFLQAFLDGTLVPLPPVP